MLRNEVRITNAGLLYTAKGLTGLLIPLGSLLVVESGNWQVVFLAAAAMNAVAAVLAKTENLLSEPRRTA